MANLKSLKVVLTADPEIPVPPRFYGGIERVIDLLARGLTSRGHEVVLVAHKDSVSAGRLVPWQGTSSQSAIDTVKNALRLRQVVTAGQFDLVHSFSRVAYLLPIFPLNVPKLMTYQRPISPRSIQLGRSLSRGTLGFSAISDWMIEHVKTLADWHVVPNGVSLETYDFKPGVEQDAPLVFLGRIEEIKGTHLAIEVAKRSGRNLVIAGNVAPDQQAWFDKNVEPAIDGKSVQYIGPVDDEQKNRLLGEAAALLMPILWDEPFGIVMAEALACGTPVVGFPRGAVPEVVVDGVTGFIRDDVDGLVAAVARLEELDRTACRDQVVERYSADAIVEEYLRIYQSICSAPKVVD